MFVLQSNILPCISWYESQGLDSMAWRGHKRGNCFVDIGDVHEHEEAMHDKQLMVRLQCIED